MAAYALRYQYNPIVVKQVWPVHSEIARRANIKGTVHVWVDKEGKPRKEDILESGVGVFNQSALDAVIRWVFTPALMKSGPVSAWGSIPFRFN